MLGSLAEKNSEFFFIYMSTIHVFQIKHDAHILSRLDGF